MKEYPTIKIKKIVSDAQSTDYGEVDTRGRRLQISSIAHACQQCRHQ